MVLPRELRGLPRLYWTLWWGTLLNKAGGFVVPFLAFYVTAQGGTEADAGLVLALYGAGSLVSGFVGGILTDRLGRRTTMLLSMFGGAAALFAMGLSPLSLLPLFTFLMGLTAELLRPAVSAAIADVVPAERRAQAYAHLYWVINLGFAMAPTLAGLVAKLDYFALFAIDAATLFLFGLVVLAWVPETRIEHAHAARATGGVGDVLRDGTFMAFSLLTFGTALVMWQNGAPLPLDMKRHGISEQHYGYLMGLNGVMIVFLQPLMGPRLALRSRTRVLAFGSLLFGVGFGLYGVVDSVAGYALAISLWTLAEIAILPLGSAVVADLAPASLRGRYQGVYAVAWGLASCAGPLVGGALLGARGGQTLWFGCALLMGLVALGHALSGSRREARERAVLAGPATVVD